MASLLYNRGKKALVAGEVDWDDNSTTTIRVLLVNASYSPNADHAYVSSVTNEVVGTGYTRKNLTTRAVTQNDANDRVECGADNITWTGLDCGTIAGAVVYKQTGGDDTTPADDILIAYMDFNDLITNGGDVTLQWNALGLFTLA
jgi:hypothetical protein